MCPTRVCAQRTRTLFTSPSRSGFIPYPSSRRRNNSNSNCCSTDFELRACTTRTFVSHFRDEQREGFSEFMLVIEIWLTRTASASDHSFRHELKQVRTPLQAARIWTAHKPDKHLPYNVISHGPYPRSCHSVQCAIGSWFKMPLLICCGLCPHARACTHVRVCGHAQRPCTPSEISCSTPDLGQKPRIFDFRRDTR